MRSALSFLGLGLVSILVFQLFKDADIYQWRRVAAVAIGVVGIQTWRLIECKRREKLISRIEHLERFNHITPRTQDKPVEVDRRQPQVN